MVQQNEHIQLNPAEETLQVGVTQIRFLVTGAESNGSLATFEMIIPAGAKNPALPHSHDAYEETIYGVEGVSTWTVNGVPVELGPGQMLCIARGAVHGFGNHSDGDAKVLTMVTPAKIGPEFFRELIAVITAAAGGPPDGARMMEVMKRYGIKPALPPSPPSS